MTPEPAPRRAAPAQVSDQTLIRFGAAFTAAAGALRLPASFIGPDAHGVAIETLYYAIDISLLFAIMTAYVAIAASRTRLGSLGFAIAAVGTGILIGPEPAGSGIDHYAIGATALAIGFAALAIAWRRSPSVSSTTRTAFLATLAIGIAAGVHDAIFLAAGLVFSFALFGLALDLRCASSRWEGGER